MQWDWDASGCRMRMHWDKLGRRIGVGDAGWGCSGVQDEDTSG